MLRSPLLAVRPPNVPVAVIVYFMAINILLSTLYLPHLLSSDHLESTGLPDRLRMQDHHSRSGLHRQRSRNGHENTAINDQEAIRYTNPRLPEILLIGAQKAGSTSLANWLHRYGICSPRVFDDEPKFYRKEVHYFDNDDRYSNGATFYAERFAHCHASSFAMDATPATMMYADRVRRTYEGWDGGSMMDKVKIIALLREPSARELSWYNHISFQCRFRQRDHSHCYNDTTNGRSSIRSYSEYVDQVTLPSLDVTMTPRSDLCRGQYARFLKEWMQYFRRNQILILSYDELVQNDQALAQRVQSFLGLDPLGSPGRVDSKNTMENKYNTTEIKYKVRQPLCETQRKLEFEFERLNEALYELLEQNQGPDMEQKPFPRFVSPNCTDVLRSMSGLREY
mmetsp:Transcript_1799/g.4248  ORF Transcript_1799/g.4248 Transcript_1799/m.4248 type:complete len:396 (-) Transcript_1799:331-1518(-)|eukprot:CAMPEP_0178491390 /NCGR_PEP_ID=MMETSP0696-20121128/11383_1 /TAXON_ID=265572 /ORGANISM="Extubocellulus spinifer, Strain CCMP396" /LENGTH=395 /DNA_ID=CAMNT_0020119253 /DNA_START=321 /DNA_END=1508 /DNA_ORIENTATION=+